MATHKGIADDEKDPTNGTPEEQGGVADLESSESRKEDSKGNPETESERLSDGDQGSNETDSAGTDSEPVSSGKRAGWYKRAKESVVSEMTNVERKLDAKEAERKESKAAKAAAKGKGVRRKSPFRRPRRNKFSEFVSIMPGKRYAVIAVVMTALVLLSWAFQYLVSYLSVGGIRTNDFLLAQLIKDGQAFPIQGIGEDGSLVTTDGVVYPEGSYSEIYPVTNRYGQTYYDRGNMIALSPVDFFSLVKMNSQPFVWFFATIIMYFGDRLYTRVGREGMKYSDGVYEKYPLWLRIMRWVVVILMIMTLGNWLSILL